MGILATEEQQRSTGAFAASGRNDLCPCGSGVKFKHCHGSGQRHESKPGNAMPSVPS
jgi:hypothetical protein